VALTETPTEFLAVIEDDPDVQLLIETIFSMDSRFSAANAAETAEEALASTRKTEPGVIVLDHGLAGLLTGLDTAPLLKALAPRAKIILFTAHAELQARATAEPAVDAFLLKTDPTRLLPLAQRLTGLDAQST
jgi:DNA-binding NarL/FixJ family response regulator